MWLRANVCERVRPPALMVSLLRSPPESAACACAQGTLALFSGLGPRVGWITIGGFVFFGAYEKAQELLWKTGGWGVKPKFQI